MWEARKIWGGIINSSRAWGMYVDGFVTNLFADPKRTAEEIYSIKRRLIYRHIAWLYELRSQLLVSAPWEHINQGFFYRMAAQRYQKKFGIGLVADEVTKIELKHYLPQDEHDRLINNLNTASQIINEQSRDLTKLREAELPEPIKSKNGILM